MAKENSVVGIVAVDAHKVSFYLNQIISLFLNALERKQQATSMHDSFMPSPP